MYHISLDLEIKNPAEIFYCVRHSTDVTLIPSSAQDTTYSLYTYIGFKMVIPSPEIIAFCRKNFIHLNSYDGVACL